MDFGQGNFYRIGLIEYALQEDDALISNLEGSFSNVVGLPLELFA